MSAPESSLSIIIPTLNEAECLPRLLEDLARQQNIHFGVYIVDGGSTDQSVQICLDYADKNASSNPRSNLLSIKLLRTVPGRGHQMNHGAQLATTDDLLFLHADTRIKDSNLLNHAQRFMNDTRNRHNKQHVAGHFPIRFASDKIYASHFYFYECKTHLNRPDCINGDQGFWISRSYFNSLGQFNESLPFMEDAKLASKIFATGRWITLPGELETSARRFETEGFTNRQILNSFLCNFNAMGVTHFFQSALDAYRAQSDAGKLQLRPFLKLAHRQMSGDGFNIALQRWYQTGAYIASNAWQLAFALDCRRNRKRGLSPGVHEIKALQFYDRYLARVTQWSVIKALTAVLTVIWFYSLFLMR